MLVKYGGLNNKYLFILIVLLSCSCNFELTNHLRELNKINSQISINNWKILTNEKDKRELRYLLRKYEGDTTYYLKFRKVFHDSIFNPGKDYYVVTDFTKEYVSDSVIHFIHQSSDTNYYYKAPISNPDSLVFIVGKYYYLCRNGKLSAPQMKYYYENEDSLKKVRGNELSEIP